MAQSDLYFETTPERGLNSLVLQDKNRLNPVNDFEFLVAEIKRIEREYVKTLEG